MVRLDTNFRLLGPVQVWFGDRQIPLSGRHRRVLLAALLLQANRVVATDRLVTALWGEEPPRTARHSLQVRASQLRHLLMAAEGDDGRLAFCPPGYLLRVAPDELDLHRFELLAESGHQRLLAGDAQGAVGLLREALGLWRGPAMEDVPVDALADHRLRLDNRRLAVQEERIEAELRLGGHERLIGELEELVSEHPLRERLRGQLMLALYRNGRQAEALAVFRRARQILVEELGVEPGSDLQRLHQAILVSDPGLQSPGASAPAAATGTDSGSVAAAEPPRSICSLPRDISDFTGRGSAVADILANTRPDAAPIVYAIDGMAGVGKTTLAVRVGHRLAPRYADAQLYLNLHGYTADATPMPAHEALRILLGALGVPEQAMASDPEERSAQWRAELAGRKALIILDNVADVRQVGPLLPGSNQCLVVVTSRRRLVELEDVRSLSLDPLPEADAVALFMRVAGDPDLGQVPYSGREPAAVAEAVRLCGYLPLAIRIAAARLRHRSSWTVDHLVAQLRDHERRRVVLYAGDRSVAASFSLSYRHLSMPHRRMFRLLASAPGDDWDTWAAAATAGIGIAEAHRLLEDLLDVHLLEQRTAGRYYFHDLLRDHAVHIADSESGEDSASDSDSESGAAERLIRYFVHRAAAAVHAIDSNRWKYSFVIPDPPVQVPEPAEPTAAIAWLEAERVNLLAAVRYADRHGLDQYAWQLPYLLWRFYNRRGYIADWISGNVVGLRATRRLGDLEAEACVLNVLGIAYDRQGMYEEAAAHYNQRLSILRDGEDLLGEANTRNNLGIVYGALGRYDEALAQYRLSLKLLCRLDRRYDAAMALSNLGEVLTRVGCYAEALSCHRDTYSVACVSGDEYAQSVALTNLGDTCTRLGRFAEALDHYQRSLEVKQRIGAKYEEGYTLTGIGNVYRHLGRHGEALTCQRRALEIMTEAGDRAGQAAVCNDLGETYRAAGRTDEATQSHTRALSLAIACNSRYEQFRARAGTGQDLHPEAAASYSYRDKAASLYMELRRSIGDIARS